MGHNGHIPETEERRANVLNALREVVQSDAFRRSARIIRFLEYVVLESLSATPRLTERTIGIVVFDRPEDWDPKADPIVRIEARRLREKLGQYYTSIPAQQAVVLNLPKGGYRVSFEWCAIPPSAEPAAHLGESEQVIPEQHSSSFHDAVVSGRLTRPSAWSRWTVWLLIVFLTLCAGLAAVSLGVSNYRVAEDRSIRLDSFRVDNRLNQEFDGTAIGGKIADQIRELQKNTRAIWTPPRIEDSWTSQRASGWSVKIEDSLRALIHPQDSFATPVSVVSGSIEDAGANEVSLYIRGTDIEPKSFVGKKNQLPELLLMASEYIYGACQPSSYSVYLTEHGRSSDAVSFTASRYPKARHLGDRVQLLYSWATALSQEGDHKGAVEKYELTIHIAPQSWGSYVALQNEYEELGETERALDTGHDLESRAHRGSWLFKHLPPILFRRPGPDAYMETDELTNDYVNLKRSMALELRSHEGGTELLPLYSFYAQVLARLHERSNAHLQLDLASRRDDHGAAEGNLIYTKVLLATEDQDDQRLRFILASYRKQIMDPSSRLALAIETDALCEIMTAYERTGDTVMSDLLSSLADDSADCLSKKAEVQMLRGNLSQALTLYQRAIVDAPSLPSLHYQYGLFLLKQGDLRRAKMEFELAHATGPHWAEPLEMLAKLAVDQGDLKAGLNLYREAAVYAPYWGYLYVSWADALVRDGKNDEAAAKLQAAESMDINTAEDADVKRVSRLIHVTNQ